MYIYMYVYTRLFRPKSRTSKCLNSKMLAGCSNRVFSCMISIWLVGAALAFTRYCNAQYCMVYGVKTGGRKGVAYCAIVLQPCGRCRWEGQYHDNRFVHNSLYVKEYLAKVKPHTSTGSSTRLFRPKSRTCKCLNSNKLAGRVSKRQARRSQALFINERSSRSWYAWRSCDPISKPCSASSRCISS